MLRLGFLGGVVGRGVGLLGLLELLLHGHQLGGDDLGGIVELLRLLSVAGCLRLLGGLQSGARLVLQVLLGLDQALHLHLQLVAVADDVGCVLGDCFVLLFCCCNRLLDLHLRVCVLVDLGVERLHEVLPALAKRVRHWSVLPVVGFVVKQVYA